MWKEYVLIPQLAGKKVLVSLPVIPLGFSQVPSNGFHHHLTSLPATAICRLMKGLRDTPALLLSLLPHIPGLPLPTHLSVFLCFTSLASWLCSCLSACLHVHSSVPAPFSRSSLLSLPPGSPFVPDLLMRNYTGSIPWHGSHRCLPASLYSITGSVENVPPQGWF